MRLIPTSVHGILDYVIGLLLIAAPWLFGFASNGAETWIPVLLGLGVIGYSAFTDYEFAMVRSISMTTHLGLDVGGGLLLALSPWLFQFANQVWIPHVVIGVIEVGTALMTQTRPSPARHTGGMHPRSH